jgi:addiction module RelE/StbE family toxin
MKIYKKKSFDKAYKKLSPKWQSCVDDTIIKLVANPSDPNLHNHALGGRLAGLRAVSVPGDIRQIFSEGEGYMVIVLIAVGTHAQVY